MLVFIVALQSPAASRDWSRVSRLTERCLRSLCNQSCASFRVVLIGNQRPAMAFDHPALTIIEWPYPVPAPTTKARMNDKFGKLKRGMVYARRWAPSHVMFADADDCVSSRLADLVERNPSCPGWVLDSGYMYSEGTNVLYRRDRFDQYCGTSSIVRCDQDDFPSSMVEPSFQFDVLRYGHKDIAHAMRVRGTPPERVPFIGAVYVMDTGENDSGVSLLPWGPQFLSSFCLSASMRQEFGLYPLD